MKNTTLISAIAAFLPLPLCRADVTLPAIISNHMVLKRDAKVPIWGKAASGEEVSVQLGEQTVRAIAGMDGKWKATLNLAQSPQGPFEMTVTGKNQIRIADVVVGEVWIASGQSNMEWILVNTLGGDREIANSANPLLRQFYVKKSTSITPLEDCEGRWITASPETSRNFTAVGYYFGKTLQTELKVPVGLILSCWGGTHSEAWTSEAAMDSVPDLKDAKEKVFAQIRSYPSMHKKWVDAFGVWLKETRREDHPFMPGDFATSETGAQDWQKVKIPGNITGANFTGDGAVWLRTEIERSQPSIGPLGLDLGSIEGFESVYWNGELLASLDYYTYPGSGFIHKYGVPVTKVKMGKNILAIRVFAPGGAARFPSVVKVDEKPVTGEWLAKQEFALPSLDSTQLSAIPQPPPAPPQPHRIASHLFNGMIAPIIPYAISGVIWYQGESNAGRAWQYRTAFPLMITDWRNHWGQGNFPFYFCQLANHQPKKPAPGQSAWAELREAQSQALKLPRTGEAVLIDLGDSDDIHPRNKEAVGKRLAAIALANDYGKKVPCSGPVFDAYKIEGSKIRITFKNADGGLAAPPVPATYMVTSKDNKTAPNVRNSPASDLEGFAIFGTDEKWSWADAKIDGDSVIVWSDTIPSPTAVRYGWADNPTLNLYSSAGLPASPFRTDNFPAVTRDEKYK